MSDEDSQGSSKNQGALTKREDFRDSDSMFQGDVYNEESELIITDIKSKDKEVGKEETKTTGNKKNYNLPQKALAASIAKNNDMMENMRASVTQTKK